MSEPVVSAAGKRLLRLLVGNPPRTVAELVKSTGRTRTAVAEQLRDLKSAELINRTTEDTPGPGRPRHLYTATDQAKRLFAANPGFPLSLEIWRAMSAVGGPELVERVLARLGNSLVARYRPRIDGGDPVERLHQLARLLEEQGVLTSLEKTGDRWVLRERTCPFMELDEDSRDVCHLEQEVFSQVVGQPLQLVGCVHDGHSSCAYALPATDTSDTATRRVF